jgi:hypothetical protein
MTVYANLVNGQVAGVYDLLPKTWNGNENFDVISAQNPAFMRVNGFRKIIRDTTDYDKNTHYMSDFPSYTVDNDEVYEHREIIQKPPVVSPTRDELLIEVRQKRDQLMRNFEWRYVRYERQQRLNLTVTDDITAMDQYMQALADITEQTDLDNLQWPVYNS